MTNDNVFKIMDAIQAVTDEVQEREKFDNDIQLYNHVIKTIEGITGMACLRTIRDEIITAPLSK